LGQNTSSPSDECNKQKAFCWAVVAFIAVGVSPNNTLMARSPSLAFCLYCLEIIAKGYNDSPILLPRGFSLRNCAYYLSVTIELTFPITNSSL
jgi:hypothetical protein